MMDWLSILGLDDSKPLPNFGRSVFEADYDKIVFSNAFRRLQDKTQVFPIPEQDFVHTRLTHSLETSSVGRSLGKEIGSWLISKNKDVEILGISVHDIGSIVGAACLAHDIGNPPFGHSGEEAISEFYRNNTAAHIFLDDLSQGEIEDLTNFEGNAQGFRLLSAQQNKSLKLSSLTLAAFTKYPRESIAPKDGKRRSQKKFGVFQSEKEFYNSIGEELSISSMSDAYTLYARHPLAFLVEAADDICYSIIDFEDGCRLGLISFEDYRDLLAGIIGDRYNQEKLESIATFEDKLGVLRAMAIARLIEEVVSVFKNNEELILEASFDKALTDEIPSRDYLMKISKLSVQNLYQCNLVNERECAGFEVINCLLERFCEPVYKHYVAKQKISAKEKNLIRLIPDYYRTRLDHNEVNTVYSYLQILNDFISGLTDTQAIGIYKVLNGLSLSSSLRFTP